MVGLADSYLSELGYIVVVQTTVLPFVLSLWFHNRSLTGWAFPSAMLLWWQYAIRYGLGVDNPLTLYTVSPDTEQAAYLFFVVLSTITVACALMGTAVAWLLGLPYLLPLESVWPDSPGLSFNSPNIDLPGQGSTNLNRQDAAVPDDCGLTAYGYDRIPKPYFHFVITLVLVVLTVALPFILFEWIYSTTILGAFLSALFIPVAGYIVSGLFWRYFTSLYTFGPNDNNMKNRDDQIALSRKDDNNTAFNGDPNLDNEMIRNAVFANTRYGIWKTVIIMGGLHVFTFLLIGGVASFTDPVDVDVLWILGITLFLCITILIAIIALIYRGVIKSRSTSCKPSPSSNNMVDDDTVELDTNSFIKNAVTRALLGKNR